MLKRRSSFPNCAACFNFFVLLCTWMNPSAAPEQYRQLIHPGEVYLMNKGYTTRNTVTTFLTPVFFRLPAHGPAFGFPNYWKNIPKK